MKEFIVDMFFRAVPFLIILAVIEAAISLRWVPCYFTFGIPIYSQRYSLSQPVDFSTALPALTEKLRGSMLPALDFKVLNDAACAFREHAFDMRLRPRLRYTAVMRGLIRLNSDTSTLVVTGYMNWYALLFAVLSAPAGMFAHLDAGVVIFVWVILVVSYAMQRYLYHTVGRMLATMPRG